MTSQNPRSENYLQSPPGYDYSQQFGALYSYDQPPNPQFNAEINATVVTVEPSPQDIAVTGSRPANLMTPAVLACYFCCWPIGICAIMAASQANAAADLGDFDTANKKARTARILIVAAVFFGIVMIPCAVALRITAFQST